MGTVFLANFLTMDEYNMDAAHPPKKQNMKEKDVKMCMNHEAKEKILSLFLVYCMIPHGKICFMVFAYTFVRNYALVSSLMVMLCVYSGAEFESIYTSIWQIFQCWIHRLCLDVDSALLFNAVWCCDILAASA